MVRWNSETLLNYVDKLREAREEISFSNDNLSGITAVDADLSDINFQSTNLKGAKLQGANFFSSNLNSSNLEGAILSGAILEEAELKQAILTDADLRNSNLNAAVFEGANLNHANLMGANLENANLRGANLENANLRFTNMFKAELYGANLKDVKLQNSGIYTARWDGLAILLPYNSCLLIPSYMGWRIQIDSWTGNLGNLQYALSSMGNIAHNIRRKIPRGVSKKYLESFSALCEAHIDANPDLIDNLYKRWADDVA